MKTSHPNLRTSLTWLSVALAAILTLVCATPAAAADEYVDLAVTVRLDKSSYEPGEEIVARVAVTNNGTATAHGVVVRVAGNLTFPRGAWSRLAETVEPGAVTEAVASTIPPVQLTAAVDVTAASTEPEHDPADNRMAVEAPVPNAAASATGVLYGDRDGDEQVDQGEGMFGVELQFNLEEVPYLARTVRTDRNGRFTVPDLLVGHYFVTAGLPTNWDGAGHVFTFLARPGANELSFRAVRNLALPLTASIRFDRDSYAVGDVVREHVTIANHGKEAVSGITAYCAGMGLENELSSASWGDLAPGTGAGVTVGPGEARTFEVTDVVPAGGREFGHVVVNCEFGVDDVYKYGVSASARAGVPGARGDLDGVLYNDVAGTGARDDNGLPGVKVYLADIAGRVVARTVTGARGRFHFAGVPVDLYELRIVGPWQPKYDPLQQVQLYESQVAFVELAVSPGPTQPDPDAPPGSPAPSTPQPPAPRPSVRPANLADTGVSVEELTALGMLLLLTGTALLLVRRTPRAR